MGTKVEFVLLLMLAFLVPIFGIRWFEWSWWTLLSLLTLWLLRSPMRAVARFSSESDPAVLIPPLGATARAAGLYGVLLGAMLALG